MTSIEYDIDNNEKIDPEECLHLLNASANYKNQRI